MCNKVEKILKGSLDLIPPPSLSMKIQIMGGKVCLRCKGKTLLGVVNKKFIDITQQCFVLLSQVNFPANNLNFHWRWWDRIQATFWNLFYFKTKEKDLATLWYFLFLTCWSLRIWNFATIFKVTGFQFSNLFFWKAVRSIKHDEIM